jgi:PEP-CTERM motif-containing protein
MVPLLNRIVKMIKLKSIAFAAGLMIVSSTAAMADVILAAGSNWEYTFVDPTGDPTWNSTTGAWAVAPAPFGNNSSGWGGDTDFDFATFWGADGSDGDDLWVRVSIDLTGYDLSTVAWDLGVDNGYSLFANGAAISSNNAEGYTYRWEYSGGFGGNLVAGANVIAVALEDHGGLTAFDMQITGRRLPKATPEPGILALLGLGLLGVAFARRSRKA